MQEAVEEQHKVEVQELLMAEVVLAKLTRLLLRNWIVTGKRSFAWID